MQVTLSALLCTVRMYDRPHILLNPLTISFETLLFICLCSYYTECCAKCLDCYYQGQYRNEGWNSDWLLVGLVFSESLTLVCSDQLIGLSSNSAQRGTFHCLINNMGTDLILVSSILFFKDLSQFPLKTSRMLCEANEMVIYW